VPVRVGIVVDVYDGDTFTLASRLPGQQTVYQFQVRVAHVDCPEMRTKDPMEKEVALKAKAFVQRLVLHQWVRLRNVRYDKYGRLLAEVWLMATDHPATEAVVSLHSLLLRERLAVPYEGDTKCSPTNWKLYHEEGVGGSCPP
jgi:endonuclease YncB( thermonuclease family)